MTRFSTFVCWFGFVCGWGSQLHGDAPQVSIETSTGRVLVGAVDDRSDEQTLWIRRAEENIVLVSAVSWHDVVTVEIDGREIEQVDLLDNLASYTTSEPQSFLTEYELLAPRGYSERFLRWQSQPRVASVEAAATLVNLDRTVEADGLLVTLAAIDTHGHTVAVRGSITARLIVERIDQHTGQVSFEEFQRWSAAVSAADFRDGTVTVPLRFRGLSPEFDWQLCTAALLNVRLTAAGQGNYEASVPVAIHEFNPIRDELRNQQGSRFFRNELTHNTRYDGPRNLHRGYSSPRRYGF